MLETIKDVTELVQKADNIDLLKQVLTLQTQAIEMVEQNRGLREKLHELEQALRFAHTLVFVPPFYYAEKDATPYCPRCWEKSHLAIHLVKVGGDFGRWDCMECKQAYLTKRDEVRAQRKAENEQRSARRRNRLPGS